MQVKARIGLVFATITFAFAPPAHAYIDPGTGSFFLQVLLASIITAGVAIKLYLQRLAGEIRSLISKSPAAKRKATKPDE